MADGAYADMYTGIETMIGVTAIATGGGTGGIATGTDNAALWQKAREPLSP
jgi:hypothetical protein